MPLSASPFLPAIAHNLIGLAALFLMIEFLRTLPIVKVIKTLATEHMPWPGPPLGGGRSRGPVYAGSIDDMLGGPRPGSGLFSRCFSDMVGTVAAGVVLGGLFYVSGLTPIAGTPQSARWILGGFAAVTLATGLVYRSRMLADARQIRNLMREVRA